MSRHTLVVSALVILIVLLFFASVLLGDYTVTIPDFFAILGGENIPGASFIVMESKLPRAVAGALTGCAFGLAGGLLQKLLRNPLASPDIIGLNYGASAAAVAAILLLGLSGLWVSLFAFVGSLTVAMLIYVLAMRGRDTQHANGRLILIGIGFGAMMVALVHWLLVRADTRKAEEALVWLNGSLNRVNWPSIQLLALAILVLVPLVVLLSKRLRVMELGDDLASSLGVRVAANRLMIVLLAVALAASATATAGPISFVAFLATPLATLILGRQASLVASALMGSLIVIGAHCFTILLLPDSPFPVGIITGILGAPALLAILTVSGRRRVEEKR